MSDRAKNLVDLYRGSCAAHAARPLFGTKKEGAWTWMTYGEFGDLVDRARGGLAALGVGAGDRVAIVADNRIEWAAAAYATYGLEAAYVPMYQAQRPAEWQYILADCGARVAIAATDKIYQALQGMRAELPKLTKVIGLELPPDHLDSWAALIAAGAAKSVPARSPSEKAIAGFIYTSGTTGKPKGALLSHGNYASNLAAVHDLFPIVPEDRTLSFLPWAHSFGQTCELHMIVSFGASTAINDALPQLLDNLAIVKPTILVAVPRIFNRIYEAVNKQIAERPGFLQRIIKGGIHGAVKRARGEHLGPIERLELAFDDKVVFGKVRDRFGGRLRWVISGSATLNREVAEFIDALGITVFEGYGLTETSPIVTANCPAGRRIGSVGKVLPGVEVEIDKTVTGDAREGEIVVRGPNVMQGYHNLPDETAKTVMANGSLRTGDLGFFDEEGFLYISGRIKEQYKLENGKYVMPSPLEEELKLSPYFANVMLHGDGRPFNVALVVPNEPAVRGWAVEKGIDLGTDLLRDERVRALVANELEERAHDFKGFERPRDFELVAEDFTVDNGLLTPTFKLKRREAAARYAALIEAMYARERSAARAAVAVGGM
jgi:long-chain acyl-CoA synthetase